MIMHTGSEAGDAMDYSWLFNMCSFLDEVIEVDFLSDCWYRDNDNG